MKTLFVIFALALALLLAPRSAHASSGVGYLCEINLVPGGSLYGPNGTLGGYVYSGPNCTGSFLFNFYVCTEGNTNSACAGNTYSALLFTALVQTAQQALVLSQKVYIQTVTSSPVLNALYYYAVGN